MDELVQRDCYKEDHQVVIGREGNSAKELKQHGWHGEKKAACAINRDLIRQQYKIIYALALRLATADATSCVDSASRAPQHPTYKALSELGKAVKWDDSRSACCPPNAQSLSDRLLLALLFFHHLLDIFGYLEMESIFAKLLPFGGYLVIKITFLFPVKVTSCDGEVIPDENNRVVGQFFVTLLLPLDPLIELA